MKTLFEELGGAYTQQGDYLLPDIKLPEQPEYEIGVWDQRRRRFLKEHHRVLYYNMMTKCTLYPHLAEVNNLAQLRFKREKLHKYFSSAYTEEQMHSDVVKGLELLKRQRECNLDDR